MQNTVSRFPEYIVSATSGVLSFTVVDRFFLGERRGKSDKQRLLKEWAADTSAMGFVHRTKKQIEEKIRNEVKRCKSTFGLWYAFIINIIIIII
ncbi:hypothetical protein Y032_0029g1856 [Ancylostoma ceylanicum]|uniref:Uncharacterized protein n=1 Tax=Ancylostoma ceylanicum TaxID=53326 RepID=A0A016UTD6_9BILA|nr:hypothetical protein Y032_0029g1856 [Ancylostoma ceylanicum]